MKKLIVIALIVCFVLSFSVCAYADALTAYSLGGVIYSIAKDAGLSFTFTSGTSAGAATWMTNKINSYLGGQSIAEKFGSDQARVVAGKLVVGQTLFNGIKDFINNLISDEDITIDATTIDGGIIGGIEDSATQSTNGKTDVGFSAYWPYEFGSIQVTSQPVHIYYNGSQVSQWGASGKWSFDSWSIQSLGNNSYKVYYNWTDGNTGNKQVTTRNITVQGVTVENKIDAVLDDYAPSGIDIGYQWEGSFDGLAPDTNLDQLIGQVYDDVADNNLDVTGEVVEEQPIPTPVPTSIPVDPDTPLQDVPWEGLNDLIDHTGEGIREQIQSQTQSVTSAQEATTEAVESLTDTITGALDVPDSEELPDFKFDVRELFPFCIPFDIYCLLSSFDAEPQAPHVQLPIVIESIGFSYNLDLDFSAWDPVAQAMRTAELIVYAIALAWATGKVIKW